MSQWEKLLSRLYELDGSLRFDDLEKILTRYGFQKRGTGTGSSHFTFRKKDHYPITIPKKNRIKKIYIIKVKEIVEKEETNEND